MAGSVKAVCTSEIKGVVKNSVDEVLLIDDYGIDGDAHAGDWHRQISLLPIESIDRMKKVIPDLEHGAFGENIVTKNFDLKNISIGDRISIGDGIILEITQIGKKCHTQCAIGIATGECIMPVEGVFARVINGGKVVPGDELVKLS